MSTSGALESRSLPIGATDTAEAFGERFEAPRRSTLRRSRQSLVVVGAGGHGRELAMIARAVGINVAGFLDDCMSAEVVTPRGLGLLGRTSSLDQYGSYCLGFGDPILRRTFDEIARDAGADATRLVHPSAVVGEEVLLAPGAVLFPGVVVTSNVSIGRQSHVNSGATINHDCVLGDYVTISPGVNLAGNVTVHTGATIGIGACVLPGRMIGRGAYVGAGATVIRDIPANTVVVGVPTRHLRVADSVW